MTIWAYTLDATRVSSLDSRQVRIWGSHTFSNKPNFFKNEKVVREKGSQWESLRMKEV